MGGLVAIRTGVRFAVGGWAGLVCRGKGGRRGEGVVGLVGCGGRWGVGWRGVTRTR